MPLDNQGCTFTFKKLTRVPLRRRRRSNHQKKKNRIVCARNVAEEGDHQPKRRCSRVPRRPESKLPVERENALKARPPHNENVVFVFKTQTFRTIVLQVSEEIRNPTARPQNVTEKQP